MPPAVLYIVTPGSPATALLLAVTLAPALALASPPQLQLGQDLLQADAGELPAADDRGDLKLQLLARFDCEMPDATAGLFVSVADTAVTTDGAKSPQTVLLTLPTKQLRGVREALSCPGIGPHLLRAQLTAYATLVCRAADGTQTTATTSHPVDLWVDCPEPAEKPETSDPEAAEQPPTG